MRRYCLSLCVAMGLSACGALAAAVPEARPDALSEVIADVDAGRFQGAEQRIGESLASTDIDADTRKALQFERERMRRILLDFSLDADQAQARLRQQIPDLVDAEFSRWDDAGLFESMEIDGQRRYFNRSPSNLFLLSAEARMRRKVQLPFVESPLQSAHPHHRQVIEQARVQDSSSVAPRRLRVTQSLTVGVDAVPAGETVRAWIPYPRSIPGQQEDIRFVSSTPDAHEIAPEAALQRTVYLEQPARDGEKTEFSVTYELTLNARHFDLDADKVVPARITPELAPLVAARAPHVVFTDDMRAFSRKVVGDETNPYRIAQKLFAAVDDIPWAGAREYSTISNIGDYALHAGHADCGQQTLLLMTLLRLNGIPARWQSGMMYADNGYWNLHDWGQLYLAPYGWVPMDVTFGRLDDADAAVANFYLGGLDAYRIAFNDDYGHDLVPAKQHFRSETVDLQRGEAEWDGGNLYFNQWDYDFSWRTIPAGSEDASS